ncbi:Galactosyl transferase [Penicillium expansum]|uniref:Galactosyl transferase n=1 Tax=Penicillium expansum TaxID=27334 RepID=A0A0A2JM18_PENEN|nr:Galactosyl transferase [Penicillium expansum]KGO43105.1 Galactosyl transferase [Penicillium expansum]KGO53852.1 Galactosyl transferase [Penicillium expansum]KGO56467.1 Galactosyl transferase [Penicillium expansum]
MYLHITVAGFICAMWAVGPTFELTKTSLLSQEIIISGILIYNEKSGIYAVMPAMIQQQMAFKQRPLNIILIVISVIGIFWVTFKSYKVLSIPQSDDAPSNKLQRVAKVSMLYGETNHMYERALQSHERHGKRWGYPMHILRQDISVGFWNKPSYLLSLVINELTKPAGERMEWLMWVDADSIILNNDMPVEIFLPPSDLKDIHLVATQDQNGLNTGIMFLHVHPWMINFLTETMGYPIYLPQIDLGRSADQESMRRVLNKTTGGTDGQGYADGVSYLPRPWINTYEWDWAYEGKRGDLLVHFPGLEERRWPHMAKWLNIVETTPQKWNLPLEETGYINKTTTYWSQIRSAKESLKSAEKKLQSGEAMSGNTTKKAISALKNALREKSDNMELVQQRLQDLNALIEMA